MATAAASVVAEEVRISAGAKQEALLAAKGVLQEEGSEEVWRGEVEMAVE